MFGIVNNIIDSVPVIGHVKGVIHYVAGDVDGGNKAMFDATRSSLVMAGGAVGAIGGPAGALAGASGAGLLTDTVCSIATLQPHGVVEGLSDVATDILHGNLPVGSVLKTGALAATDMACGLGAGGISVGVKSVTKTSTKKIIEVSSKTLLKGGIGCKGVLSSIPSDPIKAHAGRIRSSNNRSRSNSNSNDGQRSRDQSNSSRSNTTSENKDKTASSNGSGSERPNNNNNNNNTRGHVNASPMAEESEITTLRSMFNNVPLEEISLGRSSVQIFRNLTPKQKVSLVSLIKTLQRKGRFEVIIRTIIHVCNNIDAKEITFQNFLSIAEFVNVYIEEQFKDYIKWSSSIRVKKPCFTQKEESDEKLYLHCSETIVKKMNSLREKIAKFSFTKYFRDIYSAFYHYYKHRIVPITGRELDIDEYLTLIVSMMNRIESYQEYQELSNPNHPRTVLVFERYYSVISRRARIVLRSYRGTVTLSSCYIRDIYDKDDVDGKEFIINEDE